MKRKPKPASPLDTAFTVGQLIRELEKLPRRTPVRCPPGDAAAGVWLCIEEDATGRPYVELGEGCPF